MRAMLSARGRFGVFRIFVTRTAEVTSSSVDIYHSPFLGVWVRFTSAHFLEMQLISCIVTCNVRFCASKNFL